MRTLLTLRKNHLRKKMDEYWGREETLYNFYRAQYIEYLYLFMILDYESNPFEEGK